MDTIYKADNLNSTEKLLMLYIKDRAGADELVRITNLDFIDTFQFDWSTLNRNLNKLEKKGYIKRIFSEKDNRVMRLIQII